MKRTRLPSKILELSFANSMGTFQPAQVLELGLTFKKRYEKKYYLTYLAIFAQHIKSAHDNELSKYNTSALGLRLGVGMPFHFFKQNIAIYSNLAYASTATQKDPWWGLPENNLDQSPLLVFSLGVKYIHKKYTMFFRQDLNSYDSYLRTQFFGVGYLF